MTYCCSLHSQITPFVLLLSLMDFCPSNGCRLLFSAGTDPSMTINIPERIIIWYIGQILICLAVMRHQDVLLEPSDFARGVAERGNWSLHCRRLKQWGTCRLSASLCPFRWCKFLPNIWNSFYFSSAFKWLYCLFPHRIFHSSSNYGSSSTEQLASDSQICRKHKRCSRVQKNYRGDGQTARKKILNWLWSRQNQHHFGTGICFSEIVISLWQTSLIFPELLIFRGY